MSQAKMGEVVVGRAYQRTFGSDGSKGVEFLDENTELQRRLADNQWIRWDGVEGTAEEHGDWALERMKYWLHPDQDQAFRYYGTKQGCTYYINDEETKAAGGYGFFKIEATLELEPKDLLAIVMDMEAVGKEDKSVVMNKVLSTYRGPKKGDPFSAVVYWANYPGFPFLIRDGIDLTTYRRDEDGETMWQMSTSLTGGDYFQSMPGGMEATDRLFGYKLTPVVTTEGTKQTKVIMICQTVLNGYIPKSLSNYMVCRVLIDYVKSVERAVKERKEDGTHQAMLKQLELD